MHKILIANRGEIALRIMRSCKEMGIKTVAVYSIADKNMPFVHYADEAYCIGESPSNQSYLCAEKIIATALQTRAEGIHPGYGFLSENASFCKTVEAAGITFIGPSEKSIQIMGGKISAKQAAKNFDVPMVPGTDTPILDFNEATRIANETGFPLLIKASAGGGGKGMRVVNSMDELDVQLQLAKSEALNSFNDDSVFIEKYVANPKHIEIQILGDKWGNYVYLFERECSIQRRHQKLIEEAPSSCLTENIRKKMGECAVNVAKSCAYWGAGTVEFLVDDDLNFYFLEMNTRLQVEHCVTEMITGIDLVKEQIKVARGEKLSFTQADLKMNGHAIELRICAEDPENNFLPDMGKLEIYKRPQGFGIRVDDGYEQGLEIPIYYDPMLGKLIAWGNTRLEAIERLKRAILDFEIVGIQTTLRFGLWAIQHPAFVAGQFNTHFISSYFTPALLQQKNTEEEKLAAIVATVLADKIKIKPAQRILETTSNSNWWNRNKK